MPPRSRRRRRTFENHCRVEVVGALHEVRRLRLAADLPEVFRVRALLAADDDDDVDLGIVGQHARRILILFRGVADGVGALDVLRARARSACTTSSNSSALSVVW